MQPPYPQHSGSANPERPVAVVKIRITGLPAEIGQAIQILSRIPELDLLEISDPYPNRGASRLVRVYIDAQLTAESRRKEIPS
jgi:hypothetical protein